MTLSIDIESYSSIDLTKSGVYKYAESPDAELLLFGYSIDGGPVTVVDVAQGEKIPDEILAGLSDERVIKWAHQAAFERVFLSIWLQRNYPQYFRSYSIPEDTVGRYLDPTSWRCSRVWCAYMGLPLSLEDAGSVLGLDEQKMKEGKDLINYFCKPCRPTKVNGGRTRNLPTDALDKWELFKQYNKRDVEVEMSIQDKLRKFPVPDFIWEEYRRDQEINDRGIAVDMDLVKNAIHFDALSRDSIMASMKKLTGVENPNSVAQMKQWLSDKNVDTETLGKQAVAELLLTVPSDVAEVLKLRQQAAKSSVKKYTAMEHAVCSDGRARGMFQFYGANRTGRWAGRIIQLQNLPRNTLPDLEEARSLVKSGDYEQMSMLYDDVPDTLSQLIRTAFIPRPGFKLVVADFSSIEARVLAWLAGEEWRMDAFAEGKDIYCMSASQMFGVPVEKHGVNGELRQKGKVAELACVAHGQLVLTDKGTIPIKKVTKNERVWDGENWVQHDGVVFRGFRPVFRYDGLTATGDHPVYVEGREQPVYFSDAIRYGLPLHKLNHRGFSAGFDTGFEPTYDIINAGPLHRFTVSDCLVHNCGYGGSVGALKAMGALEMGLEEKELKPLVDAWRDSNPNIVQFWWDVDSAALKAVKERTTTETHGLQFSYQSGMLFITLPSGRRLCYVKPRIGENQFGGECITYEGIGKTKKWERLETYGPKLVENCLAGDTLVLTDKGLIPIIKVTADEKIWDGKEWVSHEGVIDQGIKETVKIGSLKMTLDHRILTEKGWVPCGKAEGFNWAAVSLPDGFGTGRKHEAGKTAVAMPMHMWKANRDSQQEVNRETTSSEVMRVYEKQIDQRISNNTRHESPSCVWSVAFNEAEVRRPQSSGIPQLRGAGNNRMPGMEQEFRSILERHGADLQKRSGSGSNRQRPRLQTRELPLDNKKGKQSKQKVKSHHRYTLWKNDHIGTLGTVGNRSDYAVLSAGTSLADRISVYSTGLSEHVFDIRNCGSRHRFTVYDSESGSFRIVSNCTQAISRDVLAYAMQTLSHCFIVGHVHDELIIECSKDVSVDAICEQMGRTPPWAHGLNIRADGYETMFYKKD